LVKFHWGHPNGYVKHTWCRKNTTRI